MLTDDDQALLVQAHTSLAIHWGTTAPFKIGKIYCRRIGFANDPMIEVEVNVKDCDVPALVPILRQRIYGELAERGWAPEAIDFKPSVQTGRRRKFVDENEYSESFGKNKIAETHLYHWLMLDKELITETWAHRPGTGGVYSSYTRIIPERPQEV